MKNRLMKVLLIPFKFIAFILFTIYIFTIILPTIEWIIRGEVYAFKKIDDYIYEAIEKEIGL